jgi:hypothetical protein
MLLPFEMGLISVDLPVAWSFLVAETSLPLLSLKMIMSRSILLVKARETGVSLAPSTNTSAAEVKTFMTYVVSIDGATKGSVADHP